MTSLGQFCLLVALVGSGYAAFACMVGAARRLAGACRSGALGRARPASWPSPWPVACWPDALIVKDFRFQYVARVFRRRCCPGTIRFPRFGSAKRARCCLGVVGGRAWRWSIVLPPAASSPRVRDWPSAR